MRASFIDVESVSTRYLSEGTGFPVVLLHGFGMLADAWSPNIAALAARYRVIAPDMLGCGFTSMGVNDGTPLQLRMARHMAQFVERLDLERFALVASSGAGLVGALLYFMIPGRFQSFTAVSSANVLASDPDGVRKVFAAAHANARRTFADNSLAAFRRRLSEVVHDPASIPESLLLMQLTSFALPWAWESYEGRLVGLIESLDKPDAWAWNRLSQIKTPMLLMYGRNDPRNRVEWEESLARQVPDVRTLALDNCAHFANIEHPAAVNARLLAFLAETGADRR